KYGAQSFCLPLLVCIEFKLAEIEVALKEQSPFLSQRYITAKKGCVRFTVVQKQVGPMVVAETAKARKQRMIGRLKVDLGSVFGDRVILPANRLCPVTSQMLVALVYKA